MENVEIKVQEMDYSGTEAYKSLRTNLQFCGEDKKVIAVTSCTPNEGKSSVTMNLAVSMAEAGKKVILIDADMRKSVLVGRTKVRGSVKGLTHYLSKQAPLIDVICSTNVKNLSIIFAGPVPPNPAELLGSRHFKAMLDSLKKVRDQHVDVFMGNHTINNKLVEKRQYMLEHPGENPFVDETAWGAYLDEKRDALLEFMKDSANN